MRSPRRFLVPCLIWLVSTALLTAGDLSSLPYLNDYTSERASSHDRGGANDDGNWQDPVKAGETRTIAELEGPGIIRHMWINISTNEPHDLEKIAADRERRPTL